MAKRNLMEAHQRQEALNNVSQEDLEKVKAYKASTKGAYPVDQEWLLLAEFAKAYGWQAYLAARNDEIRADEMLTLVEANRKLEARSMFSNMQSSFVGAVSAQTKKPASTFKSLTKNIIRQTKVEY